MPLFVAGFLETLNSDLNLKRTKQLGCKLQYLKSLMYTAAHQDWGTILDIHTTIVVDIECGHRH